MPTQNAAIAVRTEGFNQAAAMAVQPSIEHNKGNTVIPFIKGFVKDEPGIQTQLEALLTECPERFKKIIAFAKSRPNEKSGEQYLAQMLQFETNKAAIVTGIGSPDQHAKHLQMFDTPAKHMAQARNNDNGGVAGIFSSAFLHIPKNSPFRPK